MKEGTTAMLQSLPDRLLLGLQSDTAARQPDPSILLGNDGRQNIAVGLADLRGGCYLAGPAGSGKTSMLS